MDRVAIKEEARKKIKGNIWNILWPLLVIGVLESVIVSICGGGNQNAFVNVDVTNLDFKAIMDTTDTSFSPINLLLNILFNIVNVAYLKYILNFVRTGKFEFNDIIDCIKYKWLNILGVSVIEYLVISVGFILFIIPGIILALGLTMSSLIVIDTDLGPVESIKKSWEMMKGYKWNYFVFILSFLGWILLTPFTLGLLFIWLIPYMTVAEIIYYERLKEKK